MTTSLFRRTSILGGAIAAAITASGALADGSSENPTLGEMIEQADLVFQGEVAHIEYASSLPSGPEGTTVAHTFVTYRVEHVLHGNDPGRLLTLRFIGGLDLPSETYLRVSNAPQFDLGDVDILFVKGNASQPVPLVGGQTGRMRLIDGQMYTELGQEIQVSEDGLILKGARHLLEEIATTDVAGQMFVDDLGPQAVSGPSNAIEANQLLGLIADMAEDTPRSLVNIAQADSTQPFEGPDMTPAAPPALTDADIAEAQLDDAAEEAERRALEENPSEVRIPEKKKRIK